MPFDDSSETAASPALFAESDVATILRERGWLAVSSEAAPEEALQQWLARAAQLLAPQCEDRAALADLLSLVFHYDAPSLLQEAANQAVLARQGSRDVIREVANRVLEGGDVDSDRFKEIIDAAKAVVPYRSRELFHPVRLALAGRVGEGGLDRVILLLDPAAKIECLRTVKGTRERVIEFCGAMD